MKYIISTLLLFSICIGQTEDKYFTFTPPHPKVGETITVSYDANASNAKLKNQKEMTLQILVYRADITESDNTPDLLEATMKQEGNKWTGSIILDEPRAKYLLIQIKSENEVDNNNSKYWNALIYGNDDKPIKGAHLQRGSYFMGIGYFFFSRPKDIKNLEYAKIELEKEKELYPDNWLASIRLWNILYDEHKQDSEKTISINELNNLYDQWKTNQTALYFIYKDYNLINDSAKAQSIRDAKLKEYPQGIFAQKVLWGDILEKEITSVNKIVMIEDYFKKFPNLEEKDFEAKLSNYVYYCTDAKEYDKAIDGLSKMKHQDGQDYNSIAWSLIEKGDQLEKAVAWAKKAVLLSRNPDPDTKPWTVSRKNWNDMKKRNLGMVLDTYAYGLMQLGRYDEASENYSEAFESMEGSDPDVNTRYIECLVKTEKYTKAVEVGFECIRKGKDIPKLIDLVKEAIVKIDGSGKNYDEISSEEKKNFETVVIEANHIKEEASKKRSEELKTKLIESRTSKPSIDFTLKDLKGDSVTLSSFKGKVLVVDFWATWCGPCKQSFPILQKIVDKYQKSDKIKFLAVNSWERQKDYNAQLENAKKFISDNKYTFQVLIDEKKDDQFNVITKYEVEGIPTQFIIDKVGNIAWKNVGMSPDMENELTLQIETLLSE